MATRRQCAIRGRCLRMGPTQEAGCRDTTGCQDGRLQGHFIPAAKFGQYDNLPEFRKFDENDVIEEILRRSGDFLVFDS